MRDITHKAKQKHKVEAWFASSQTALLAMTETSLIISAMRNPYRNDEDQLDHQRMT